MLVEALDHLVRGIVSNPDDVEVRQRRSRGSNPRFTPRGDMLEVRVHPDDLGRVIGRSGRTATALRTVLNALSRDGDVRIDFVDVDRRRPG
jgi:uncharacterized protein